MPFLSKNDIKVIKSRRFASRIINLYKYLVSNKHEYVLSKQVLRSGTSIGANIREATRAQSEADFIAKLYIALKESDETCYWLELLKDGDFITDKQFNSLYSEAEELLKILNAIISSIKKKNQKS